MPRFERHQVLLKEITHRVKNSLAIVASMLKLQANEVNDPALTSHLEEAAYRVSASRKERTNASTRVPARTSSISAAMSGTFAKI